jgi:hypothetical protein
MILLDSVEILAAVHRSLEAHVLPELGEGFARVQVQAALMALTDVVDRLEKGDPCERMNQRIEADARELAESARADSPAFAERLEAALAATPEGGESRDRARQLGEALWSLVCDSEDPAAAKLLEVVRDRAIQSAQEDVVWMCPEAIHSLT